VLKGILQRQLAEADREAGWTPQERALFRKANLELEESREASDRIEQQKMAEERERIAAKLSASRGRTAMEQAELEADREERPRVRLAPVRAPAWGKVYAHADRHRSADRSGAQGPSGPTRQESAVGRDPAAAPSLKRFFRIESLSGAKYPTADFIASTASSPRRAPVEPIASGKKAVDGSGDG
jgi:hypothetical protein